MEAVAIEPKYMTFEEMKEAFPNEWVILGDPKEKKGMKVQGGYVLFHHPDRREAAYQGRHLTKGFKLYTWVYTGEFKRFPQLGLFKKITLPAESNPFSTPKLNGMNTSTATGYMTFEEMKAAFPDEWILLGDPVREGVKVKAGVVLFHHPDKREVAYEGRHFAKGHSRYTWVFTGEFRRIPRLGIFRKITLPDEKI